MFVCVISFSLLYPHPHYTQHINCTLVAAAGTAGVVRIGDD